MKTLVRFLWLLVGAAITNLMDAYAIAHGGNKSELVSFLIFATVIAAGHVIEWSVEYLMLRRNMNKLTTEEYALWITRSDAVVYGAVHDIDATPSPEHIVLIIRERD